MIHTAIFKRASFNLLAMIRKISVLLFALAVCTFAHAQLPIQNGEVTVENETKVNTEKLEFSPVFYKDGIVYVSSENDGLRYAVTDERISHNVFSIYQSTRDEEGNLKMGHPLARELLSDLHEGPLTFNTTGELMYFTRNDSKVTSNTSGNVLKKLNIFSAQMADNKWGNITEMPFNEPQYNTCHPSITPDLDELYFASDRPGGYGGYDLYVVRKIGGEWSSPVNLGPQVNTPDNEVFPFIHADGTLYFGSNGHGGAGGLDLFYSTKTRDVWRRPVNMGEPFNTGSDDFGIIVDRDNKNGYFSSARGGGSGGDDIYRFNVLADDIKDEILVTVVDAVTNDPLEAAEIAWVNLNEVNLPPGKDAETLRLESISGENGEMIFKLNSGNDLNKGLTDLDGQFVVTLPNGEYVLRASRDGYLPTHIGFSVPPSTGDNTFIIPLDKAVDCVPINGAVTDISYGTVQAGAAVVIREVESRKEFRTTTDNSGQYSYCLKCGIEYQIWAEKSGKQSAKRTISTKNQPCDDQLGFTENLAISIGSTGGPITTNPPGRTNPNDPYRDPNDPYRDPSDPYRDPYNPSTPRYDDLSGGTVGAPIREGTIIQLPNIYYNFDDAGLRPDARADLDLVVRMMNLYPEMEIELGSHTDSRGTDGYNRSLSQRRSDRCVDYLVSQGISAGRINAVGYGESKPRNRCVNGRKCSESEHQENRRTEVVVTRLGNSYSTLLRDDAAIQQLESYAVGEGGTNNREYYDESPTTTSYDSYDSYNERSSSSTTTTDYNAVPVATAKKYYVIAGTFRNAENASVRKGEVMNRGFSNVEVIKFDYPNYHAVCVDKFAQESDARAMVRELQAQDINSYVRRID